MVCRGTCPSTIFVYYRVLALRHPLTQGKPERDASYKPILDALSTIYKDVPDEDRCVLPRSHV